jgi:hypothetical protein
MRDVQHDVFLAEPEGADGARIVPTVSWVQHHATHLSRTAFRDTADRLAGDVDDQAEGLRKVEGPARCGTAEIEHDPRGRPSRPDTHSLHETFLNRLSDLLFVLARVLARHENGSEVLWRHDRGR